MKLRCFGLGLVVGAFIIRYVWNPTSPLVPLASLFGLGLVFGDYFRGNGND